MMVKTRYAAEQEIPTAQKIETIVKDRTGVKEWQTEPIRNETACAFVKKQK